LKEEVREKEREEQPKLKTCEMLSEFRGEDGSKGQELLEKGEYQSAINFFDKKLEIYPKSVYYTFGKGSALAGLGKHEEAIEYYDKIIETSNYYLIGWFPTFVDLHDITCSAYNEKLRSLNTIERSMEAKRLAQQFIEYLDAFPPDRFVDNFENFWLYRARALVRNSQTDACLISVKQAIEQAIIIYKLGHSKNEWKIFTDRLKQEKGFESIMNDEHFNRAIIDKTPELYDIFPTGTNYRIYQVLINLLNNAKSNIRKGEIDEGLKRLQFAIELYKRRVIGNWLINRLKQEKDFESIVNDERFKKLFF
jgi:tetratricopeptide (TPR) repeat protein